jgi:hypothetical protein
MNIETSFMDLLQQKLENCDDMGLFPYHDIPLVLGFFSNIYKICKPLVLKISTKIMKKIRDSRNNNSNMKKKIMKSNTTVNNLKAIFVTALLNILSFSVINHNSIIVLGNQLKELVKGLLL